MNLLQVTSSLDPRGGGVAEAVRQLSLALVRAGHRTTVATLDAPGAEWLRDLPFPVHALGPSRGGFQYASGLAPWLREQRGDFDAVISHGLWQYHGLATWRAWRHPSARGPRFVFPHGMLDPWFKRAYPRKHLKKWFYWLAAEYHLLRDARAVLFTCEEERRLARESFRLYRANELIAPLGIAEPPGEAARQREAFLEKFPHLRGKRFLLFLGRLHPKKGCDLLLSAALQLATRGGEDLRLVFAGPGDPQEVWRACWRARQGNGRPSARAGLDPNETTYRGRKVGTWSPADLTWTGMLTGDLKWGALHAAEAFILPSHQENFGLAVVEALACGKPVLLSDKVNIWREITADAAGFAAPDTLDGTRELLEHWLALPAAERAAMGRRARTCFEQRFQIDRAAATLVERLRECGVSGNAECGVRSAE